jgi:hypothetical protein
MTIAASSLLIALLTAPAGVDSVHPSTPVTLQTTVGSPAPAIRIAPIAAEEAASPAVLRDRFAPKWTLDAKRPAALPAMYAGLGALHALDLYSTRRAVAAGAREMNPLLAPAIKNAAAMVAVKGASTALSIYFAERAWKRNRKGAMVLMAVVNGVTAAVVAKNLQNAR